MCKLYYPNKLIVLTLLHCLEIEDSNSYSYSLKDG